MKSNLKVLTIVETDPPDLLAECVNNQLFKILKMQPIPVLIQKMSSGRWVGFCSSTDHTQSNEIVIAEELFDVRSARLRSRQIEEVLDTYLHECAHRLTPSHGHDAAFLCLNMILHLRAGGRQIWQVKIYDAHQEKYFKEAWHWAWSLATELYETDETAENCANTVMSKYADWTGWMDSADNRAAEAELLKQMTIAKRNKTAQTASNQIISLKQDRLLWAFYATVISILTVSYFN